MTEALSQQELSDLISRIYDCTLDPSRWEPTLDVMKGAMRVQNAFVHVNDLVGGQMLIAASVGIDPFWLDRQAALWPEVRGILMRVLDSGHSMDEPSVASRFMSRSDLAASRYAQQWGKPQSLVDYMDFFLIHSPTRLASLGFSRHERDGNITDREIEIGRLLIPHLRRALTISNVLDTQAVEKARMAEALDALKLGVVLANEDSRILHANRVAEQMMREGGPLRDRNGVLRAEGEAASAEINAAIGHAARNETDIGNTGLAVRLTGEHEAAVVAHVLPLAAGELRSRLDPAAVAAVFINPQVDDAAGATAIAATFGLTPAETRVAARVLSGKTVAEAAADVGVAVTTARTHLASIFAKTGVSRQSELMRLAAQLAPVAHLSMGE
jgi:DNA-binding CsgD family transcriptional regulator/PAS domain-containing protein